jgi:hypothetical protein
VDVRVELEVSKVAKRNAAPARSVSDAAITDYVRPTCGQSIRTAFDGCLTSCNNSPSKSLILPSQQHEMSTYTSQYPAVEFDPAYKKFFEEFYATSDAPEAHEDYVQYFTKYATVIMASKTVVGSEGSPLCSSPSQVLRYDSFSDSTTYRFLVVTNFWSRNTCLAQRHVGKGFKQSAQAIEDIPVRTALRRTHALRDGELRPEVRRRVQQRLGGKGSPCKRRWQSENGLLSSVPGATPSSRATKRGLRTDSTRIPGFSNSRLIVCNYNAVNRGHARGLINVRFIKNRIPETVPNHPLQCEATTVGSSM